MGAEWQGRVGIGGLIRNCTDFSCCSGPTGEPSRFLTEDWHVGFFVNAFTLARGHGVKSRCEETAAEMQGEGGVGARVQV